MTRMKIGYCPLASGSKGNCILVKTEQATLLFDMGISLKQLENALHRFAINIEEIDAVIVSHEHTDHICGIPALVKRHPIPIIANADTTKALFAYAKTTLPCKIFVTGEPFSFKDVKVHPFSVQHDTLDPVAFTVGYKEEKLGICTDLGFATTFIERHLSGCTYLYIESNHDIEMVHASSRSFVYKQRVLSRQGHLSNESAAALLKKIIHKKLRHIYLAHLSEECNTKEKAIESVRNKIGSSIQLDVALQWESSSFVEF